MEVHRAQLISGGRTYYKASYHIRYGTSPRLVRNNQTPEWYFLRWFWKPNVLLFFHQCAHLFVSTIPQLNKLYRVVESGPHCGKL